MRLFCALVVLTAQGRGRHKVGKAWHKAGEASRLPGQEGRLRWVMEGSRGETLSSGLSDKQLLGVGVSWKRAGRGVHWLVLSSTDVFVHHTIL